jgi:hypothetical protein
MFKEERDESQFEWSMLGDIAEGRPNLGPMVHVAVYRLMQFTLRDMLIREFGVETADRIFFEAGKKAVEEYCKNVLTDKSDLSSCFADIQRTAELSMTSSGTPSWWFLVPPWRCPTRLNVRSAVASRCRKLCRG